MKWNDGDRDACRAIVEEHRDDLEDAEALLAEARRAGRELPSGAKRTLSTAWSSYKQTIKGHEPVEAIAEFQSEPEHADRSMAMINGTGKAYGQKPIDFDGVSEVPEVNISESISGQVTPEIAGVDVGIDTGIYQSPFEYNYS